MNIIPQQQGNIQVGIPQNTGDSDILQDKYGIEGVNFSKMQSEAYRLYDIGFNVFPQPFAKKGGYAWKRLQHTRLVREHESYPLHRLFAGQCNMAIMCGKTSGNLFVIDCESRGAFHYHMSQLQQRGVAIWAVQTARGGHLYLRCADGEVQTIETGILKNAEIKGRNGYVLAPPSIHPNGDIYQWVMQEGVQPPVVTAAQIDWLQDKNGEMISLTVDPEVSYTPGNWRIQRHKTNLSRTTQDYVKNGHLMAEGSRNNRLFKAACDLKGNEYSFSECKDLLEPVARSSGLPQHEIDSTIKSAYSKQRTPSRPNAQIKKTSTAWQAALAYGMEHAWSGRSASSQRALYLALVERARVSSNEKEVFRASIRELATLARLSTTTVQKHLVKLQNLEMIHSCGQDHQSNASLWRFTDRVLQKGHELELKLNTISPSPHWLRYSVFLFNSDASERAAIGHGVMFIYQFMVTYNDGYMPSELAAILDITVNQANYALRKLRGLELVERLDDGWRALPLPMTELEAHVAAFADVTGKGERREQQFARERQIFASRLLFFVRFHAEKDSFRNALSQEVSMACWKDVKRTIAIVEDDPLLQLGLELGGVIRCKTGVRLYLRE